MAAYSVTVTDRATGESHGDPEPCASIFEAKDWAATLLRRIYADAPEEVYADVQAFIRRINEHRGELLLDDPYLDCAVEIVAV